MPATTTHYQLPYPESSDQIRLIPDQMKAMATKIDSELTHAGITWETSPDNLPTDAVPGQTAYVRAAGQEAALVSGEYVYYGGWKRPSIPAGIITLRQNAYFATEVWQWQTNGQPYAYIRARAKQDLTSTTTVNSWMIGTTAEPYRPPLSARFPAVCNNTANSTQFMIQIANTGAVLVETFATGAKLNTNDVVLAQLTWPCPSVGEIQTSVMQ